MTSLGELSESKRSWRDVLLKQRRSLPETTRSAETEMLRPAVSDWIERHGMATVCAYVPVGGEPGSLDLLDALRSAGCRVLLPVVTGASPLEWSVYEGGESLRRADFGLLEPAGERLGSSAIGTADGILVPALAVDGSGVRLGRGAGHYDRSLPLAAADADRVAVVRDSEFVDELPGEEHDVLMNAALTPERGVVRLPV
ncbi:5-formyltetrahydrofolate cyclo-ligase [Parasphingorhabdus pacifica]